MLNPIPIHAAGIYQEDGDDDHIGNDFYLSLKIGHLADQFFMHCLRFLPFMILPVLQITFTVFHQNFADTELLNS